MIRLSIVFLILFATPAYAYIDPGTGATFIGSIGPLLMGLAAGAIAVFGKYFWHPLKSLFGRGKTAEETEGSSEEE